MNRSFKNYNRLLLLILGVIILMLVCMAAYMRPVEGSLTRLGGYLENDFGLNVSQPVFRQPLFSMAGNPAAYDKYSDVVVIGDSFSRAKDVGWQNFLSNVTGLSIITFDILKVTPDEILSSRTFREYPPRLFIYESVENMISLRNNMCKSGSEILSELPANESDVGQFVISPLGVHTEQSAVSKSAIFTGHLDLDAAANYVSKMMMRNIFGMNLTSVESLELKRSDLFSSTESGTLLVLINDLWKSSVTREDIKTAICSLHKLQRKVQGNGRTRFLFLPAPDKLSAYSKYLIRNEISDLAVIHKLEDDKLNMLRTDMIFSAAVEKGVIDLYLSNDNHWSALGHEIVARSICDYLMKSGLLTTRASAGGGQNCSIESR